MADVPNRCDWCLGSEAMIAYHDEVWGVPIYEDQPLYAKLILDGAQAGLSWSTILNKREGYYRAFEGLDPAVVATYGEEQEARLLADAGIVRNRQKIRSAIANARGVLAIQEELGSFSDYLWSFVDHRPIVNTWSSISQVPAETEISKRLSKELKGRGFNFVGPTILYAFMQAVGMVNDHLVSCFRHGVETGAGRVSPSSASDRR
ncbi:MAG: DNA-3-methyladenine glycosylase I [Thermoanaerobaculia bacterium]|nr:DNA-3-methyladenine glycosylase I [Thermoanaerobaculia bacterium]